MFFNKPITMKPLAGTVINKCVAKRIELTMDRLMFLLTIMFLADKHLDTPRITTTGITVRCGKINVDNLRWDLGFDRAVIFTNFVDYDILLPTKLNGLVDEIINRYAAKPFSEVNDIISKFNTDSDYRLLYKLGDNIYKA